MSLVFLLAAFPQNLWSLSFSLVMGGTGYLMLALMYALIDVLRVWNGAPFVYVGLNSILVYCCHEVFADYFPFGSACTWDGARQQPGRV